MAIFSGMFTRLAVAAAQARAHLIFTNTWGRSPLRARNTIELRKAWLVAVGNSLDGLSPLKTLARGYAVARDPDGRTLSSVRDFAVGGDFALTLRDGRVGARAVSIDGGAA